jgi:hypothetical protein
MTDLLLVDEQAASWTGTPTASSCTSWPTSGSAIWSPAPDWSQGWLNESWATFCEACGGSTVHEPPPTPPGTTAGRPRRATSKRTSGRYRRPDRELRLPRADRRVRPSPVREGLARCCARPAPPRSATTAFFGAACSAYLTAARPRERAHARHFRRALEEVSGRDLGGFFDHVDPRAAATRCSRSSSAEEAGDSLVTIQVKQCGSPAGRGAGGVSELPLRAGAGGGRRRDRRDRPHPGRGRAGADVRALPVTGAHRARCGWTRASACWRS